MERSKPLQFNDYELKEYRYIYYQIHTLYSSEFLGRVKPWVNLNYSCLYICLRSDGYVYASLGRKVFPPNPKKLGLPKVNIAEYTDQNHYWFLTKSPLTEDTFFTYVYADTVEVNLSWREDKTDNNNIEEPSRKELRERVTELFFTKLNGRSPFNNEIVGATSLGAYVPAIPKIKMAGKVILRGLPSIELIATSVLQYYMVSQNLTYDVVLNSVDKTFLGITSFDNLTDPVFSKYAGLRFIEAIHLIINDAYKIEGVTYDFNGGEVCLLSSYSQFGPRVKINYTGRSNLALVRMHGGVSQFLNQWLNDLKPMNISNLIQFNEFINKSAVHEKSSV